MMMNLNCMSSDKNYISSRRKTCQSDMNMDPVLYKIDTVNWNFYQASSDGKSWLEECNPTLDLLF